MSQNAFCVLHWEQVSKRKFLMMCYVRCYFYYNLCDLYFVYLTQRSYIKVLLKYNRIKSMMNRALILDGRNIFDAEELRGLGFEYHCIGRWHWHTNTKAPHINSVANTIIHTRDDKVRQTVDANSKEGHERRHWHNHIRRPSTMTPYTSIYE